MECFFWTVGIVFEPQYYSCRIMLTKVFTLITTFDDIYDIYQPLDELKDQPLQKWLVYRFILLVEETYD
ncbi:putative (E)-beta-ocimene synthase [Helianthus anomalus]